MKNSLHHQILEDANWTVFLMERFLMACKKDKKVGLLNVVSEKKITVFSSKAFTQFITDLYLKNVERKRIQSYMKEFCLNIYKIMPQIEKLAINLIANSEHSTKEIKMWGTAKEQSRNSPEDLRDEKFSKTVMVEDMMEYCADIYHYVNNKYFKLKPRPELNKDINVLKKPETKTTLAAIKEIKPNKKRGRKSNVRLDAETLKDGTLEILFEDEKIYRKLIEYLEKKKLVKKDKRGVHFFKIRGRNRIIATLYSSLKNDKYFKIKYKTLDRDEAAELIKNTFYNIKNEGYAGRNLDGGNLNEKSNAKYVKYYDEFKESLSLN